jgi:hypothetical protein
MAGYYCVRGNEKKSPAHGQGVDVQLRGRQLRYSLEVQDTLPWREGKSLGFLL